MSDLRETIAKAMDEVMFARFPVTALKAADRILAIPEIAEALEARAEVTALRHDLKRSMDRENTSLNLGHSITVHRD